MVGDIPYSGTTGDPVSVEWRQDVEQSVASHSPCDVRGRTSAVDPETEVVPPPSVCSTAVGPPRRTSPPPGRHPPVTRTPALPDGERWLYDSDWRNPYTLLLGSAASYPSES